MKLPEFIRSLSEESSINRKIELLESVIGTELEEEVMFYFYNSLNSELNFYIKKIPVYTTSTKSYNGFTDKFRNLLKKFSSRSITGNKARDAVQESLSEMSYDYAILACNILLKDPKCGVSVKTVSKVFHDLIPEKPKLCKANSFSEKNMQYIKYPAYSQRKADGARVLIFTGKYNEKPKIVTSNGNLITCLPSLEEFIKKHFPLKYVIDGELLFVENGKVLDRKTGNGLVSRCISNTLPHELEQNARVCAWDIFSDAVYRGNEKSETYSNRFMYLITLCSNVAPKEVPFIEAIETKVVNDFDEAYSHFREMIERGEEGTILKNTSSYWEGKRIKDCCKFKLAIQNTLKVTGYEYGDVNSKYAGMLGALTCESSDGKIRVNVGSGFTDEDRKSITPENSIGKFIEVVSNGIINTVDREEYSLFLPRFVEFRFDKDEADSFDAVKATTSCSNLLTERKKG